MTMKCPCPPGYACGSDGNCHAIQPISGHDLSSFSDLVFNHIMGCNPDGVVSTDKSAICALTTKDYNSLGGLLWMVYKHSVMSGLSLDILSHWKSRLMAGRFVPFTTEELAYARVELKCANPTVDPKTISADSTVIVIGILVAGVAAFLIARRWFRWTKED